MTGGGRGIQKYKLRRLGLTNEIIDESDSDNVKMAHRFLFDSKSNDKIGIRLQFEID